MERDRVRKIDVSSVTWWRWWWYSFTIFFAKIYFISFRPSIFSSICLRFHIPGIVSRDYHRKNWDGSSRKTDNRILVSLKWTVLERKRTWSLDILRIDKQDSKDSNKNGSNSVSVAFFLGSNHILFVHFLIFFSLFFIFYFLLAEIHFRNKKMCTNLKIINRKLAVYLMR